MFKFRDLTIVDVIPDYNMVISCDSSGGIGNKENDVVKVDPETVGYFATHVALMELLATGASPISIVNTLGVEMEDTGKRIIMGIKNALKPLNLDDDIVVTGSTEENIPVSQTAMGITIIGMIEKSKWRSKKPKRNDVAVILGIPKVGQEIIDDNGINIMTIHLLLELLKKPYVKDILPVGSKGIDYELNEMATSNELNYEIYDKIDIDLKKSAGPATCVIIAIERDYYEDLSTFINIPITLLGIFK